MVWESTQGQNMRPNRISHIYIYRINYYLYIFLCIVNATIGFSENLFLVMLNIHAEFHLPTKCQTFVIVPDSFFCAICQNGEKIQSYAVTLTLV